MTTPGTVPNIGDIVLYGTTGGAAPAIVLRSATTENAFEPPGVAVEGHTVHLEAFPAVWIGLQLSVSEDANVGGSYSELVQTVGTWRWPPS